MSVFHFKQFSIEQSRSAMKVGTDAMLLGSFAGYDSPESILDVGTGTGVISLMLAQRFTQSRVLAVELEEGAYEEACRNFTNSPFYDRVSCERADFIQFDSGDKFDLIVSNPPFFVDSLLSDNLARNRARHTSSLPPKLFMKKSVGLLTNDGMVEVIIPFDLVEVWQDASREVGLSISRVIEIKGKPSSKPNRAILTFKKIGEVLERKTFTVRDQNGKYTNEYISLTSAFHDRVPK